MLPGIESMNCQNLAVSAQVMYHVARVESSFNPLAIGVVGGYLIRQPENLPEALATARMLESKGYNFSLGLAQINRYNLDKYGIDSYQKAFEACPNLLAGSRILAECYDRSGRDWGKSFSCYYSGNFVTGYRHGYVQKIYASMRIDEHQPIKSTSARAIPVINQRFARATGKKTPSLYGKRRSEDSNRIMAQRTHTSTPLAAPMSYAGAMNVDQAVVLNPKSLPKEANAPQGAASSDPTQSATDRAFVF